MASPGQRTEPTLRASRISIAPMAHNCGGALLCKQWDNSPGQRGSDGGNFETGSPVLPTLIWLAVIVHAEFISRRTLCPIIDRLASLMHDIVAPNDFLASTKNRLNSLLKRPPQ